MRQAADELRARAGRRDGDVRRQPQHQRLEHLHRRLRVLRLRPGQALARRLRARPRTSSRGACARRSSSAPPRSACSRASIPTGRSRTTSSWLRVAKDDGAAAPPARVLADGGRPHGGASLPLDEVFERLRDGRPRLDARARPPRCCTTACASASRRTSCRWRAGSRSSRPAHAAGLRSTVTVMFGHIEEPWELAEHMRVVRELQERTGGFTEFVPLSFIPFHTLLGPHARDRGDLARGEPQAHGGLPAGAGQDDPEPAGELGEDGARRRHRGAALGRQRPRRHADGGVDLAAWRAPTTASSSSRRT